MAGFDILSLAVLSETVHGRYDIKGEMFCQQYFFNFILRLPRRCAPRNDPL
jgi:hypothetical protein